MARCAAAIVALCWLLGAAAASAAADPTTPEGWLCPHNDTWSDGATSLFTNEQYDKAAEIYRAVLAVEPTNKCAANGLVAVGLKTKAVADAKTPTFPARVNKSWSGDASEFFSPWGGPLLAGLGIVVFLLVLARLLTPLMVGPHDRAWSSDTMRRVGSVAGFGLVVLAASAPIVASAIPAATLSRPWAGLPLGLGLATAVILLAVVILKKVLKKAQTGQTVDRVAGRGLLWCGVLGGALFIAVGGLGLGFEEFRTAWAWVLALGAVLGVLGVALVAVTRGQVLRLVVDVRGNSGSADDNASHYIVGRLGQLGAQPPRGLEVPEQTDVTALPADALTSLPDAALAKALFRVLQVFRPAVPWRATVGLQDDNTVTVSLRRNGRAVGATSFSRAELRLPALPKDPDQDTKPLADAATRHLLTAVAAHILLVLSERHRQLRNGLCGAKDSRALAMYAIAADPSDAVGAELRRALFSAAVAADPDNALARVGDLNRLGTAAKLTDQLEAAQAASQLCNYLMKKKETSYEALILRLQFTIAATYLNAMLLGAKEAKKVVGAVRELVKALKAPPNRRKDTDSLDNLRMDLRDATYFLVMGAQHMLVSIKLPDKLTDEVTAVSESPWRKVAGETPVTGPVAYDRACWRVSTTTDDWQRCAIDDLRIAVTNPELRIWARRDPSLANLRADDRWRKKFCELVCDPPTGFLDIGEIAPYKEALKTIGITSARDLLSISPIMVALRLGVSLPTTRRWRGLAELATDLATDSSMPDGMVNVLSQLGIYTSAELTRRRDAGTLLTGATPEQALFLPL